ncbi:flagellar hook-basal body complex protein FliE [Sagittula salina]|uniref:Flagellar hook-basal body complex protein FliE n=1 Tax=Sagittula salina TaxID=2820268 RepID=A0A940MRL9_9RHOB|nr:flagellar hook-basal body complex protein FliE [Sagittula salina]MBP0484560.1 flagellar hook-basal body complex protein FliE [Sagittula salina]
MADPLTTSLLSVNQASGAYRASREMSSLQVPPTAEETQNTSFGDMLARAGHDAAASMREAEATAKGGLTGSASTQAVVEATLELDSTVRVAVSVRDKLVEAYQEITRMPI